MRGVHFAAVFATTAAVAAQNQVAARFGHTAGDGLSVNMYTYIYTWDNLLEYKYLTIIRIIEVVKNETGTF
jgi:hypothetical protein